MPRTPKQIRASERNWAKARIMGMTQYGQALLTKEEQVVMQRIRNLQEQLLNSWDVNTKKLLS